MQNSLSKQIVTVREGEEFAGQNLIRALNHPLRVRILEILSEREASPKSLESILGEKLQTISYHARVLYKCGCVELTRTEQKRGAVEHFYRALPESYIGHQLWRDVPRTLQGSVIVASLKDFVGKLFATLKAGMVKEEDTALSAMTLSLDATGRAEAERLMQGTLTQLRDLDSQSRERAATGGSVLTPFMGAVAFFASASPSKARDRQ